MIIDNVPELTGKTNQFSATFIQGKNKCGPEVDAILSG